MWKVVVHRLVISEDLPSIQSHDRDIILKTIFKKLSINHEQYGEPLRHGLKGYWKLKVSHYRIIYSVDNDVVRVHILKIGIRRDEAVYQEMFSRLKKI
jgi:mRNA interferase RelE/StbE